MDQVTSVQFPELGLIFPREPLGPQLQQCAFTAHCVLCFCLAHIRESRPCPCHVLFRNQTQIHMN